MHILYSKPPYALPSTCLAHSYKWGRDIHGNANLDDLASNFTFRFPPSTGFFYIVPTHSLPHRDSPAVWDTPIGIGGKLHQELWLEIREKIFFTIYLYL